MAVVDRNADKHKVRDLAEAFVAFLHEDESQRAFADFRFRPTNQSVAAAFAATFASLPELFTIAHLGGWDNIFATVFGPQGSWTRSIEELARAQ